MQHSSWPRHQSLAGRQHIQSPSAASRSSAAADNSMQYSLDKMSEASPEGAATSTILAGPPAFMSDCTAQRMIQRCSKAA